MSLHRTNTFAYGPVRSGPGRVRSMAGTIRKLDKFVCSPAAGCWATWLLADSDGGGAIRRNESTNQHTQQIRQQDADASTLHAPRSTLTAAHCVSFPFPADDVDCSKVCLSISKMVFVKWAPSAPAAQSVTMSLRLSVCWASGFA